MSACNKNDVGKMLAENSYPGRGIIIGCSPDGKKAMIAYFIMGRSENSRNRIFERFEGGMRTKAFDESKLSDPSLIIYNPYLSLDNIDIITNGDQTNTIYDYVKENKDDYFAFDKALHTREFEPDAPNFTPRISGIVYYAPEGKVSYKLSILKSADEKGEASKRFFYSYEALAGKGHFIHTYKGEGDPLPSFYGEPFEVKIPDTLKEFSEILWNNLNEDNKVSLFLRSVSLETGETEEIIINKNK